MKPISHVWIVIITTVLIGCREEDLSCDQSNVVCHPPTTLCTDSTSEVAIPSEFNSPTRDFGDYALPIKPFEYKGYVVRSEQELYDKFHSSTYPTVDFCKYSLLLISVDLPEPRYSKTSDKLYKRCDQYTHSITITYDSTGGAPSNVLRVYYVTVVPKISKCDKVNFNLTINQ